MQLFSILAGVWKTVQMDVERNRGEQFEFMIRELESTPFCWKIVWHDLDVASSTYVPVHDT